MSPAHSRRSVLLALFLVAGLVTTACSGSSGGSGDAGGGGDRDTVGPGADARADSGPQGDGVVGQDQLVAGDIKLPPGAECVHDEDCGDGRFCDCRYQCQANPAARCDRDMNCGSGSYCEPCTRTCQTQLELCQPCLSEARCDLRTGFCEPTGAQCWSANTATPSHCLDYIGGQSYCGLACVSNFGCPQGFECLDVGHGETQKQCVRFTGDCASGDQCEADNDCPYGEVCGVYKVCGRGCDLDDPNACPVGQVCSAFRCQAACDDTENPCPAGYECSAEDGKCRIPGSCVDWTDCLVPETFCDPATNMCAPGCLEDRDCKRSGYICEAGACEKQACEHNWYCAFEQVCNKESGECEAAQGPYCDTCDPNVENACGEGNECIGLQDEDGNKLGDFCFVQCQPGESDRCPQGYQCAPLQDQNGTVQNEVCFRDCSKPPAGVE